MNFKKSLKSGITIKEKRNYLGISKYDLVKEIYNSSGVKITYNYLRLLEKDEVSISRSLYVLIDNILNEKIKFFNSQIGFGDKEFKILKRINK